MSVPLACNHINQHRLHAVGIADLSAAVLAATKANPRRMRCASSRPLGVNQDICTVTALPLRAQKAISVTLLSLVLTDLHIARRVMCDNIGDV